jgi:hypothetical protein
MNKVLTKQIYGSVCIPRAYCKEGGDTVFIVNNEYSCCGSKYVDTAKKEKLIRIVQSDHIKRKIKDSLRKEILEHQKNKCVYCDCDLTVSHIYRADKCKYIKMSVHFDHFEPWAYGGNNHKSNMNASCCICNLIKADHHFINIESARLYINERRKEKGI